MNYKSMTIRQTRQVKQYEPINVELTIEFDETEDPMTAMNEAYNKIQEFFATHLSKPQDAVSNDKILFRVK